MMGTRQEECSLGLQECNHCIKNLVGHTHYSIAMGQVWNEGTPRTGPV